MIQHTPGPWYVSGGDIMAEWLDEMDRMNRWVATVSPASGAALNMTDYANASLITLAREMAAVLRDICNEPPLYQDDLQAIERGKVERARAHCEHDGRQAPRDVELRERVKLCDPVRVAGDDDVHYRPPPSPIPAGSPRQARTTVVAQASRTDYLPDRCCQECDASPNLRPGPIRRSSRLRRARWRAHQRPSRVPRAPSRRQ